jgi:RNA polymerase sigma factor (sigma-70 family)
MATRQGIAQAIHGITAQCRDEQATDRELLRRFVERRDQDAFVVLVRRHGALVLGVGLRVLGRRQDAEDVSQATFLILARKARTTAWRESVAPWLYDVARRLAMKARKAADRRRVRERQAEPRPTPDALADITLRDLQTMLDEELARLPHNLRAPLVLCCLEGKTRDEAARCLAVPLSTVISRLLEGRELLRRRLAHRGVPLAMAVAGFTLLSEPAHAALPAPLVAATARAALEVLAGRVGAGVVSAPVAALVNGGMHAMFLMKLKTAAVVVVATCLLAVGATTLTQGAAGQAQVSAPEKSSAPVVPAGGDKKAAGPRKAALDRALQIARELDPKDTRWPEEKVRLLAGIAAAQARAGDRDAAGKTFQLALDLVKDVENGIHKCGAFGAIAYHQLQVDDVKGARKTLAALVAFREKSEDANVLLNANNGYNGILAGIAQAEARAGDVKAALKTAQALESEGHKTFVFAAVAREQAKRKDVAGALETLAHIDSDLVKTQVLVDLAKIQEGTDKAGAAKTWRLVLASLRKLDFLEPVDLDPGRSRVNFQAVIPALAERGHGDAVQAWVEGLRSPEVKVKLLLILAGGNS